MKTMTFKQLMQFFCILTLGLFATACNESKVEKKQNYLQITASQTGMTEDDTEGIQLRLQLAYTPEQNTTVQLALKGNEGDIVQLEKTEVTFQKGEKEKTLRLTSNHKNLLTEDRRIEILFAGSNDPLVQLLEGFTLTIKPAVGVDVLTEAQKKIIEDYKAKTGIDLHRLLGVLEGEITVTFHLEDKASYNKNEDTRSWSGKTILSLAEESTADNIILNMKSNPLLMTDFMHELLYHLTINDVSETWYAQPYPQAVLKAIGFDRAKETFDMTLNHIMLNDDRSLSFTGMKAGAMNTDSIVAVPFSYNFSAWTRLKDMALHNGTAIVNDGDTQAEYSLNELIAAGGSLDPNDYLFTTAIDQDGWENEPSDWIQPMAMLDEKAGTLIFVFPFDFANASGYSHIKVIYRLK